jgi:molecular chaperone DnaK (HSP70)
MQTEVEIKAVALDAHGSTIIGSFVLAGITPNRVGLPQVVVTFDLSEELVLLVTAHDRIDDQMKQLVIKDRLPTPPRERPT